MCNVEVPNNMKACNSGDVTTAVLWLKKNVNVSDKVVFVFAYFVICFCFCFWCCSAGMFSNPYCKLEIRLKQSIMWK